MVGSRSWTGNGCNSHSHSIKRAVAIVTHCCWCTSLIAQSTSLPPKSVLPSTSYSTPLTITDLVSSPAFNLLQYLSPISEKSPMFNPPSVPNEKGKVRTEASPFVLYIADLPHPPAATMGTLGGTSLGGPFGICSIEAGGTSEVLWWLEAKCESLVG